LADYPGPAPANGHGIAPRENLALSAFFFLYYAAVAFGVAFVPVFMKERGLSLAEIGVTSALSAVVAGFAQARLGHLSDAIGSRKGICAVSCVMLGVSYLFYGFGHSFAGFLALCLWSGVFYLVAFSLPAAIISDLTSAAGSTARGFSATRIWGTIGFIASLVLISLWPAIAQGTSFLYWIAGFYIASAIPILMVREAPITTTDHGMFKGAMNVLRSQRSWVFLACYTLFRTCESGVLNYMGLYVKQLGGDSSVWSMAYLIAAVAEIPMVLLMGKISDRVGRKGPLIVAFIAWPIRLYAYSLLVVPTSIYYIQLFHGFTYGIMLICAVAYMSDIAPRDLRGTAQGLLNTGSAISMAVGPLLVGILGDALGLAATFRVMAAITVVGLALLVLFVREPKAQPGESVQSCVSD